MANPLISVVMPAYNHERYVGAAIDSVLAQTCPDWELIVIDDGSTDRTGDVIRGYADPRIRAFSQENQDAFNALNRGLSLVRGQFVAILNSDDVYAPARLERLAAVFREVPEPAAAFTDVEPIDAAGAPIPRGAHYWHTWHARNRLHYAGTGDLYAGFLRGNLLVTTSNLFMTATAARQVGGFAPLRYLHDYDYIFRLMLAFPGGVRYLDKDVLLGYRIHGANTLKQGAVTAREQDRDLIARYLRLGVPESCRVRVETGAARLLELERELEAVRRALRWGRLRGPLERLIRLKQRWWRR